MRSKLDTLNRVISDFFMLSMKTVGGDAWESLMKCVCKRLSVFDFCLKKYFVHSVNARLLLGCIPALFRIYFDMIPPPPPPEFSLSCLNFETVRPEQTLDRNVIFRMSKWAWQREYLHYDKPHWSVFFIIIFKPVRVIGRSPTENIRLSICGPRTAAGPQILVSIILYVSPQL
jgi:hypothetical protein